MANVGHALKESEDGQVLLFAEIDSDRLIRAVAANYSHTLQPRDCIAQISVDIDAAVHASLMEASNRKWPLVLRQFFHCRAPQPDVSMRHVVVAVGEYHPVGGPRSCVDGC